MIHSAQFFGERLLNIFQKFQNMESYFQIFQIPDPRKSVFWPGGRFCMFFRSKNLPSCLPYGQFYINSLRCSTTVFPMNLRVNMALALVLKQFLNNRNTCKRGIGKIRIF